MHEPELHPSPRLDQASRERVQVFAHNPHLGPGRVPAQGLQQPDGDLQRLRPKRERSLPHQVERRHPIRLRLLAKDRKDASGRTLEHRVKLPRRKFEALLEGDELARVRFDHFASWRRRGKGVDQGRGKPQRGANVMDLETERPVQPERRVVVLADIESPVPAARRTHLRDRVGEEGTAGAGPPREGIDDEVTNIAMQSEDLREAVPDRLPPALRHRRRGNQIIAPLLRRGCGLARAQHRKPPFKVRVVAGGRGAEAGCHWIQTTFLAIDRAAAQPHSGTARA